MKSYKTELDPNDKQVTHLLQHAGAARWAYNWGLRRKIAARQSQQKTPTAIDLHKELNLLKNLPQESGGVSWMYEVSKCAPQEALRNLDTAYENFFRRCKSKAKRKGFPKFKSRNRGIGSFSLTGAIHVTERTIQLPRLGVLRLKEDGYFPVGVPIKSATISERAGKWFVSISTDEPEPVRPTGTEVLGCDVGIKHLAVLSDGTVFENPRALKNAQTRLRLLQKTVSRRVKGSSNRRKAVHRLAHQHYRVHSIRTDSLHKATSAIATRAKVLVIESLNVSGMMKNHRLAGALSDSGLAEFHRQLEYKLKWSGGQLIKADRFFPSSKTCSACGTVKESLSLSERIFICDCGFSLDRDLNAAINLRNLAGSSPVTACCPGSSGLNRPRIQTKLLVGQEPNANTGAMSLFGSV